MANDITGPMALPIFKQMANEVFDKDKVILVPDHFTPNKDIKSAENSKAIREFSLNQCLTPVSYTHLDVYKRQTILFVFYVLTYQIYNDFMIYIQMFALVIFYNS